MRVSGTDGRGHHQHADDRHQINDEFRCLESSFGFAATRGTTRGRRRTFDTVGGGVVRTMGRNGMRSGIIDGQVVLLLTGLECVDRCCDWGATSTGVRANYLAEVVVGRGFAG